MSPEGDSPRVMFFMAFTFEDLIDSLRASHSNFF
jgi:hypothetical protein